jgi:hypothetical protein
MAERRAMTVVCRILLPRPRKIPDQIIVPPMPPDVVIQRDCGDWWLGLYDNAPGGFPSRTFAAAVAARQAVRA